MEANRNVGAKEVLIKYVGHDTALIIDSIVRGVVKGRHVSLDDNHQEPFTKNLAMNARSNNLTSGFFYGSTFHRIIDFEVE